MQLPDATGAGSRDPVSLLRRIPDAPAWIDVRGMVLSGRWRLAGGSASEAGAVIRSTDFPFAAVVGEPPADILREALAPEEGKRDFHLLVPAGEGSPAQITTREALPRWGRRTVLLHRRDGRPAEGLAPADVAIHYAEGRAEGWEPERVDGEVRREVLLALRRGCPLAVAVAAGRPVSFCYAPWVTETQWDVAVNTLGPWRRRGLATAVFEALGRRLAGRGLHPVWGCFADNHPSRALAHRLGFLEAARVPVFRPGSASSSASSPPSAAEGVS